MDLSQLVCCVDAVRRYCTVFCGNKFSVRCGDCKLCTCKWLFCDTVKLTDNKSAVLFVFNCDSDYILFFACDIHSFGSIAYNVTVGSFCFLDHICARFKSCDYDCTVSGSGVFTYNSTATAACSRKVSNLEFCTLKNLSCIGVNLFNYKSRKRNILKGDFLIFAALDVDFLCFI